MRLLAFTILSGLYAMCFGQTNVATWSATVNELENNEQELVISVDLKENWKIYSQFTEEGGPLPTVIIFDHSDAIERIGGITESRNFKSAYSDLFEIQVISAGKRASFFQKFRKKDTTENITIHIRYMCCDGDKCIPPTNETITVKI